MPTRKRPHINASSSVPSLALTLLLAVGSALSAAAPAHAAEPEPTNQPPVPPATPPGAPTSPAAPSEEQPSPSEPQRSAAELTADAYRAIFAKLPTDLAALDTMPTGKGLDSWLLFADHPHLAALADALVAVSQRESCDFEQTERLQPSLTHHEPYHRARNLLQHRMVAMLLGDRTQPPDDFGRMPEPVGVDIEAATKYAVALLNMAVHFGERGTLAERRVAASAPEELLGLARRVPQGTPWAIEAITQSRFVAPLNELFHYQPAAIARLRFMADTARQTPDAFLQTYDLIPANAPPGSPSIAALPERYHAALTHIADALEEDWDTQQPMQHPLALVRTLPRDLTLARAVLMEIARSATEIAAIRDDINALLRSTGQSAPNEAKPSNQP